MIEHHSRLKAYKGENHHQGPDESLRNATPGNGPITDHSSIIDNSHQDELVDEYSEDLNRRRNGNLPGDSNRLEEGPIRNITIDRPTRRGVRRPARFDDCFLGDSYWKGQDLCPVTSRKHH